MLNTRQFCDLPPVGGDALYVKMCENEFAVSILQTEHGFPRKRNVGSLPDAPTG
jgi:hypothetical protein